MGEIYCWKIGRNLRACPISLGFTPLNFYPVKFVDNFIRTENIKVHPVKQVDMDCMDSTDVR